MTTRENRGRYDRSKLRYPSDLTDEEWALVAPLIPAAKRGGNKRTVNLREVANGLMYILSTGCQWAARPGSALFRLSSRGALRWRRKDGGNGQGVDVLGKRGWDDLRDRVIVVSYSASRSLRTAAI